MIRTLGTILAGLLGLAFGSFMNVCLSRWPEGESVVKPRSHCRSCGQTLAWWENVPLASWIALRGRCRTCKAGISWRYPLVELAVGALWTLESWHSLKAADPMLPVSVILYQASIGLGFMVLLWLLIALAVLDAENLWLPNRLTWPGIVLGILTSVVWFGIAVDLNKTYFGEIPMPSLPVTLAMESMNWLGRLFEAANLPRSIEPLLAVAGPLIAASIVLLIRWTYWLIRRREGIGLGDAKLMAMLGAWLGLSGALLSFAIGVLLGAVFALIALAVPAGRRGSETWLAARLPLGTFLCIGGIISALWGQPVIAAYMRWAGF